MEPAFEHVPKIDVHSRTWEAVCRYVDQRVASLTRQIVDPTVSWADTQYLRGELASLRRLKDELGKQAEQRSDR